MLCLCCNVHGETRVDLALSDRERAMLPPLCCPKIAPLIRCYYLPSISHGYRATFQIRYSRHTRVLNVIVRPTLLLLFCPRPRISTTLGLKFHFSFSIKWYIKCWGHVRGFYQERRLCNGSFACPTRFDVPKENFSREVSNLKGLTAEA